MRAQIGTYKTETTRGVPQGLGSSPGLFNIFIEGIINIFEAEGIYIQLYADDLICVCRNKKEVEKSISLIESFAEEN